MASKGGAFAVMGGSIIAAFGFAALVTDTYIGSGQLDSGTYFRLWSATALVIALGVLTMAGGVLTGGRGDRRRRVGVVLGVVASSAGAFASLLLIMIISGAGEALSGSSALAQLSLGYEILFAGSIITLFAGFPLSLFGAASAYAEGEDEVEPAADPEKEPSEASTQKDG